MLLKMIGERMWIVSCWNGGFAYISLRVTLRMSGGDEKERAGVSLHFKKREGIAKCVPQERGICDVM